MSEINSGYEDNPNAISIIKTIGGWKSEYESDTENSFISPEEIINAV